MDKSFSLYIISPERIFYQGKIDFVEFVTTEGKVGIYKDHIPMTNLIEPGIIKIYESAGEEGKPSGKKDAKKAALHAGFVEILPEEITIIAEAAEWPEEIDANRAREAEIRAKRRLDSHDSNVDMRRAELALKRAIARLEVL